jgi:signal transduction histidine kinase
MALNADQPAEAAACLVTIENAGRSVLAEVRWLVGLLRDESSCPGLTELPDLVASARRSGLDVSLLGPDPLPDLPANLSETIYRTVQEALTNVVRHSGRRSAEVELSCADSAVSVLVRNDGTADGPDGLAGLEGRERQGERAVAGSGLRGMQERVTAAGGNLRFGPQPNGGWLVRASFPSPDHSTARTRRTRRQPGQLL